jgi:hypothetical protein
MHIRRTRYCAGGRHPRFGGQASRSGASEADPGPDSVDYQPLRPAVAAGPPTLPAIVRGPDKAPHLYLATGDPDAPKRTFIRRPPLARSAPARRGARPNSRAAAGFRPRGRKRPSSGGSAGAWAMAKANRCVQESFRSAMAASRRERSACSSPASISRNEVAVGTARLSFIRATSRSPTPVIGTTVAPSGAPAAAGGSARVSSGVVSSMAPGRAYSPARCRPCRGGQARSAGRKLSAWRTGDPSPPASDCPASSSRPPARPAFPART